MHYGGCSGWRRPTRARGEMGGPGQDDLTPRRGHQLFWFPVTVVLFLLT